LVFGLSEDKDLLVFFKQNPANLFYYGLQAPKGGFMAANILPWLKITPPNPGKLRFQKLWELMAKKVNPNNFHALII
jgi:hypothetical protein